MDQIFITDLVARGIIGINDLERTTPQEMLINVEPLAADPASLCLEDPQVEKPGAVEFSRTVGTKSNGQKKIASQEITHE